MEQVDNLHKHPLTTVCADCVIFGYREEKLYVLLFEPFPGTYAIPEDALKEDETVKQGALRVIKEKTGLALADLDEIGWFAKPEGDTREHSVSIAYFALADMEEVRCSEDEASPKWIPVAGLQLNNKKTDVKAKPLAFNHSEILSKAVKKLEEKILSLPVGHGLLPESFGTMKELKQLYDATVRKPYHYEFPHPSVATDCVIFGYDVNSLKLNVLLIERGIDPYKGQYALPGGFVGVNETADDAALRELKEETQLDLNENDRKKVKQFGCFTDPNRDPRDRVMSIAYFALVKMSEVSGGDDAAAAEWKPIDEIQLPSDNEEPCDDKKLRLAFDHGEILRVALKKLREEIHFEPVGFDLLPEKFTMKQLRGLYETILGVSFDRGNFAKKMQHAVLTDPDTNCDPYRYSFDEGKYDKLKQKGFKLEFSGVQSTAE